MATPPKETPPTEQMRAHWRRFAAESPMFYIASQRDDWTEEEFFANGAGAAAPVIEWSRKLDSGRVLEIGCGLGRVLVHIAPLFEHANGVDIAPEMIGSARAHGHLPANVSLDVCSGAGLSPIADRSVDLTYSLQVFQHIPASEVIEAYLHEIARVLTPGGGAWLHFDTRPQSIGSRMLRLLPDWLLPRSRRRFIRRYRLPADAPGRMADAAGLQLEGELEPGTDSHVLMLRLPEAEPAR